MEEKFENILLIAGSGRNVGKTTLACQVLQKEKAKNPVAVKITPHFHKTTEGLVEIETGENWKLFEETNRTTQKDSSLYLQNGAAKSYLVQATDNGLADAFGVLQKFLPKNNPVVIESAALVHLIQPGLFVVVLSTDIEKRKEIGQITGKANLTVVSNGKNFHPSPSNIVFNKSWLFI